MRRQATTSIQPVHGCPVAAWRCRSGGLDRKVWERVSADPRETEARQTSCLGLRVCALRETRASARSACSSERSSTRAESGLADAETCPRRLLSSLNREQSGWFRSNPNPAVSLLGAPFGASSAGFTRWQHRVGVDRHHRRRWLSAQGFAPRVKEKAPAWQAERSRHRGCPQLLERRVGTGHTPRREAQGSIGRRLSGNGEMFAATSSEDQGLEIERDRWGPCSQEHQTRLDLRNGEKARTVVTRLRLRMRTSFEGHAP